VAVPERFRLTIAVAVASKLGGAPGPIDMFVGRLGSGEGVGKFMFIGRGGIFCSVSAKKEKFIFSHGILN
jgi:hypothetical protein